jgi:predicted patatin/cPLA2 family phospholipase
MEEDLLKIWMPLKEKIDIDYLSKVNYDTQIGLRLELLAYEYKEKYLGKKVKVEFDYQPLSIRFFHHWEGWSKIYDKLLKRKDKSYFYIVENSNYLEWYKEEKYMDTVENTKHYMIVTQEEIIEILDDKEPKVYVE